MKMRAVPAMAFDFINFIHFIQLYFINWKWPPAALAGFCCKGKSAIYCIRASEMIKALLKTNYQLSSTLFTCGELPSLECNKKNSF